MVENVLKNLVKINTVEDKDNEKMMDYLENFFTEYGFEVTRLKNATTGKEILTAQYGENPAIGMMGHTDTVAVIDGWETDPFELTEKDGMLYGLGSCDMKGGIAAIMAAVAETDFSRVKNGIKVIFTYDEETMFNGIKDAINSKVEFPPHVIVAEPTGNIPMTGSKGLLEYILTFRGVTTHSSTPIEGKSSNKNAVRFLNEMMNLEEELRKNPNDFFEVPYPTMNIGIMNGGTAINKVPAETKVYMDFRICNSEKEYKHIRETVDKALEGVDADYEIINDIPSFINEGKLIHEYETITGRKGRPFFGITEASFFEGDRIIIGPGPVTAHEKNEHVSRESLHESVAIYKKMIEKLCF